jgi:hypothetical protein
MFKAVLGVIIRSYVRVGKLQLILRRLNYAFLTDPFGNSSIHRPSASLIVL